MGIPRDRVVAVVAQRQGLKRVSTGYLISPNTVLTAAHGLELSEPSIDKTAAVSTLSAETITVVRRDESADATLFHARDGIDVAVLELDTALLSSPVDAPTWGRVDRTASGRWLTAEAVGYPQWQAQADGSSTAPRDLAELRGVIRPLEGAGSGLLTIRDRDLETVNVPAMPSHASPWGGLSGAAVFTESDHLIGVVIEHRPHDGTAALRILPIDTIIERDETRTVTPHLGLKDPGSVPWAHPDPGMALAQARRTAQRLRPEDGLDGREQELATLRTRTNEHAWTSVVAEAFAGKTALLATLVLDPPDGVAIAGCFLRRREGLASTEYVLDSLSAQLAALTWGEPFIPQAHGKAELFEQLLAQATAACVRRGERLAMVIDGLDEYDPQASLPLRSWLPRSLPDGASLIVSGRPGSVPSTHPLREATLSLAPFPGSDELWQAARHELEHVLQAPDPLAGMVAAYLAATGGELTEVELAQLCTADGLSTHVTQVASVVVRHFDRTLTRVPPKNPLVFTHVAYRDALLELVGPTEATRARTGIDHWVDPMRQSGWSVGTTSYALRPYARYLRSSLDEARKAGDAAMAQALAERLTTTVSSVNRWLALFRAEGTPVAGDAEVAECVQALFEVADAGLVDVNETRLQAAVVGLSRGLVRDRVGSVAEAVAYVWALDGRLDQALELAGSVREPDGRAYALAAAVGGAASAGSDAATVEAAAQAALAATDDAGPYRDKAVGTLVSALLQAGWFGAAAEVAAALQTNEARALAIARVSRAAAATGRGALARALVDQVREIPINNDNTDIFWAAVHASEALALSGDEDQALATLEQALAAAATGWGAKESKYASYAGDIIDVGRLRCRALGVRSDASLTELLELDPAFEEMSRMLGWTRLAAWRAAHVAAAWSASAPTGARELAELVAADLLRGHESDWDGQNSWIGATPADITEVLITAGILDGAVGLLDRELPHGWHVRGTELRIQLVEALGAAGRLDDAQQIAARIGDPVRAGALAMAAAACLRRCRSGELPAHLDPTARSLVESTFDTAAEDESRDRLRTVRQRVRQRVKEMTSSHPQAGLAGDVDEDEVSRVGEAARDATDPFNTVAWGRTFLRRLRALSEVRPDAAAAYVPLASACVTKSFDAIQAHVVAPLDTFHAARDLTQVLLTLGRPNDAREVASTMATTLSTRFGAIDAASCAVDTVPSLERVGLLDHARADALIDIAWACENESSWSWHAPGRFAVAFADVSPASASLLSGAVPALVRADLDNSLVTRRLSGLRQWYETALAVLTSLVDNDQAGPAAEVAELLWGAASDPATLWFERGAILGGLVRSGEPTTIDRSLTRFLTEDAFADHVDHLPLDLLRRLSERLEAADASAESASL